MIYNLNSICYIILIGLVLFLFDVLPKYLIKNLRFQLSLQFFWVCLYISRIFYTVLLATIDNYVD